jgi:hypothetical protein
LQNQGGVDFPQNPDIQGLPPELQKQVEEILKHISMQPKLGVRVNDITMKWGGVRLGKVETTAGARGERRPHRHGRGP